MKTAYRMFCFFWFLNSIVVETQAANSPQEDLLAATFKISQNEHSGTCFIVSNHKPDPAHPRRVILATAAHVLEQMKEEDCEVVLRSGSQDRGFHRLPVAITIREGEKPNWKRHPDVDVAALQFELPEAAFVEPIPFGQIASEVQLVNRTIHTGQETWVGCFPAKLEANDAGWPVLRRGSIATYPLIPVKQAKTILVDYKVFGGDSGAPVAVIHEGKLLVIAVASSMQRQTDKSSMPFEERTMHTPMGLSIAVQATYLRETINALLAE